MKRLLATVVAFALASQFIVAQSQPASLRSADELKREAQAALAQTTGRIKLPGLKQQVEILRDEWGVPHIYARSADDLFFAQGFVAAQDRLWQMELWRRAAEGKLAEVIGPAAIERDKFARLMRYRGDMDAEWKSYAPDARRIIESFVAGVNAFIETSRDHLPIEFQLTGIKPEAWTPEVCLSRIAGLEVAGNVSREVLRAQLVRELGVEKAAELMETDPPKKLEVPAGLDLEGIDAKILAGQQTANAPLNFTPPNGSNNWVVSGALTATGKPILANDPHRSIALPSLRYMVHLSAPGWNVIGAGEPALPGVAIGHNERIGFGLTVGGIDQQDLYVEETSAQDATRYLDRGVWQPMKIEREEIKVKGQAAPVVAELRFTRHGPVIYEDAQRHRAYALRSVMSEAGTAAYLASLALDRATDWKSFLKALERWRAPVENFVYADVSGNTGWQKAGMAPVRNGWPGLLPVPGASGRYEWTGFLPLSELPHAYNPPEHLMATANDNNLPAGYRHEIGFEFSPPTRVRRIREVLRSRKNWTVEDFARLQHDELSVVAREIVPYLRGLKVEDAGVRQAINRLLAWDFIISKDSAAAAIYEAWFTRLSNNLVSALVPEKMVRLASGATILPLLLSSLKNPERLGENAQAKRDEILARSMAEAVGDLRARLGADMQEWRWGDLHVAEFKHAMATDEARRAIFNLKSVPRGGDANTVNATSGANFKQAHGASFREILDLSNWDHSLAINVPGQSGQPESPHYADLLPLWSDGKYFPLLFSRGKVEQRTRERLVLEPSQ